MRHLVSAALLLCLLAPIPEALAQTNNQESTAPPVSPRQSIPPEQLDTLLAPIALYPDALVVQILTCASSPYQVRQVSDWLNHNPDLKGTAIQDAASKEGFDASFIAIVLFPQVVHQMADDMDWTRQLGQAFTTDRDGVMASIQRLRKEAQSVGNLKTTPQQNVQTVTTDGGQQVIVIQPANPQVVYVPQYNPQVVYTEPAPAPATTATQDSSGQAVAAGLIGFAAGVIVGAAADDDDDHYYYSCGGWGYARPICYPGGYNSYYQHRENMANDYYDHRENMARQRGENQANRRDAWSPGQADREQSRSEAQSNRSENRAIASDNRGANQASRSGAWQSRGTTSSRGAYQGERQVSSRSSGMQSGAFSSYQRGSTERASSARGRSSMSRSEFGGRRGGRGGGGRGRRR